MTTVALIAKEPIPGRVKTRLYPDLSYEAAAMVAAAAIQDTVAVVNGLPAAERILFFDGALRPPGTEDWRVLQQPSGDLDERLGELFDSVDGRLLLIGMDTPQLTVEDLLPLFESGDGSIDGWFGPANDGGFWALALEKPAGDLIRGVPMSRDDTGALQLARLEAAELSIRRLPTLMDVDTFQEALTVAELAPETNFARTLGSLR